MAGTALQCFELAKRGLERALTHKYVQAEIAAEFPQHWQGDAFFYDLGSGSCAHLVSLERPHGICPMLLSNDETAKHFAVSKLNAAKAIKAGRPAHIVHTAQTLTFAQHEGSPRTFGAFTTWLERVEPGQTRAIIDAMSRNFRKSIRYS